MLDIETLSTTPNAVILTIGAVKFSRLSKTDRIHRCNTFYRRVTADSCKEVGLHTSKETREWWATQSSAAKYEALENKDRVSLQKALSEFSEWFRGSKYVWAHGDDFDCVILNSAYKACGMVAPWKFWNTRDTRTVYDIAELHINCVPVVQAHHALHDAYRQVVVLQKSFELLNLT